MYLSTSGRFGSGELNSLLRQARLRSLEENGNKVCTIDLGNVVEVNAVGLMGLTLLITYLDREDYRITINLPRSALASNMLYEHISPHVRDVGRGWKGLLTIPGVTWSRSADTIDDDKERKQYFRLVQLTKSEDALPLLGDIWAHLSDKLGFTADESGRFCASLSELCQNIHHHSQSEMGGFAAVDLRWDHNRPLVTVALGDLGIGIRSSLEAAGNRFPSDLEAIRSAVREGVSSKKKENAGRGGGLARCRSHAEERDYAFGIRSGLGYWFTTRRKETQLPEAWCPGTQVYFALGAV